MNHFRTIIIAAILTATAVWQQALAGNVTLSEDGNGGYYAVIPTNGDPYKTRAVNTLTLSNASVTSFKVYDSGGSDGPYSKGYGALIINAPSGYVIQLTGTLTTSNYSCGFYVFDGNTFSGNYSNKINSVTRSDPSGTTMDIGTVTSSGTGMYLLFEEEFSNSNNYAGLDLTITLIDQTPHTVSVENVAGGSITASPTSAAVNTDITLTVSPSAGYRMTDVRVVDGYMNDVALAWDGSFSSSASFFMPGTDAVVMPRFTNNLTSEGGIFVNMPKTGSATVNAASLIGVSSFKVYDDGGRDGNYSQGCDGTLTLIAPSGYRLRLEGKVMNRGNGNAFYVYDGTGTGGTALINGVTPSSYYISIDVSASSTGTSLTLRMVTSTNEAPEVGLDLTVYVSDPNHTYAIGKGSMPDGGDISLTVGGSAVTSAHPGDIVTVSATTPLSYDFNGINVTYNSGKTVTIKNTSESGTSFTMPSEAVTVTPIFTKIPDAVSYINADGNEASCTRYTVVENSSGNVEIDDQWVVVKGNVTINGQLSLTSDGCSLILCDGATLTINSASWGLYVPNGSLNIYAQSSGTGTLSVTTTSYDAIKSSDSITISGGNVTATCNGSGDGIRGRNAVTINGGNVSAMGGLDGICCHYGTITLGWLKPTDRIYANSYNFVAIPNIKDGQFMTDGSAVYSGFVIDEYYHVNIPIDGKTLQPAVKITLPTGVTASGTGVITQGDDTYALPGATVTLGAATGYTVIEVSSSEVSITESEGVYSFTVPITNVTVSATVTQNTTLDLTLNAATVMGEDKYVSSFYNGTLDYQLPAGAAAYTASLVDNAVVFYRIGENSDIIPHGTAVIILSDAASVTLTRLDSNPLVSPHAGNLLQGSDIPIATPSGTVFVLGVDGEGNMAFVKFTGEMIPAGKAYYVKL